MTPPVHLYPDANAPRARVRPPRPDIPMPFESDDADLLAGYRAAIVAKHNPAVAALRPQIAAVLGYDPLAALQADAAPPPRVWEIATAFHLADDAGVTLRDIIRSKRAYEDNGYEVVLKSDARDPDRLNVWTRARPFVAPAPRWTPERVAEYRALFADGDGLDALARQDAAEQGEGA